MASLCQENKNDKQEDMAWSVTRHTQMPPIDGCKRLLHGIDTLDLGVFVKWEKGWESLQDKLQAMKAKAARSDGVLDLTPSGREFLHLPSGKAPNYRYHLKFPEYHLYIGITHPPKQSPNVYVSFASEALWLKGVEKSLFQLYSDLSAFNGTILKTQVSRCDLCADFMLSAPPNLEFIKEHKVSRTKTINAYEKKDCLETFYAGDRGAMIQIRIYDKGKEISKLGGKKWFERLWGVKQPKNIWRIEFQMRREALKSFCIDTPEDLINQAPAIWEYLTGEWFSLRLPTNERQNRREVHPWWQEVQATATQFGEILPLERFVKDDTLPSVDWFIQHMSGMLPSYAARKGIRDLTSATQSLCIDLFCNWDMREYGNFYEEYDKRLMRLGFTTMEVEENE